MRKLFMNVCVLYTGLCISAQEVVWQKDLKSSTQDFLSQVTTTIDQQYLITGSSIQFKSRSQTADRTKTEQRL
ncbi:hypothetical protein OWR28_12830 [Chryseobacterium sp. 1B4]